MTEWRPMATHKAPRQPDTTTPEAQLAEAELHHITGYQLAQASIVTAQLFIEHVGKPFELRPVEFTVLMLIADNPGVSSRQLSRALAMTPPNITMWVDKLVERNLVTRERSATDGRAQHLSTTEAGLALARQSCQVLREAERMALGAALSPAEQALLIELLHKLACCRSED
jgi:DNA-binding MarR family transcriptional regulator